MDTVPLSACHLSVGYGENIIVKTADLEIAKGKITALLGPNGCGKSTLLKSLARVLKPISGSVLLNGKDISNIPTRYVSKQLALLPQGPIAPEGLTVFELVAQGRFPHQTLFRQWSAEDQIAVERAIEVADLNVLAKRPVHCLSGGERQRCWIAMVLAQDTPILLLDEPCTLLDLKVQVELMVLFQRIVTEDERTMVLVLHELNLAASFADHIVMMRDGQIVANGAGTDVIKPDVLRKVFDLQADVILDPATGRPVCLPRSRSTENAAK